MTSHLDLEVLAAQLRRDSDDLALYSGFLLNVLSAALPPHLVRVRRERGWRARRGGREPAVLGISATLGAHRYELDRDGVGGYPVAKICHESGGVVLSTRTVGMEEWSRSLAADLITLAGTSAAAAEVLRRLTAP